MRRMALVAAAVAGVALAPSASAQKPDFSITIGPGGVKLETDRDHDKHRPDWRPRCYDRDEFRRAIAFQGWERPHDWEPGRGDVVKLKAWQWGGLYRLEVDECYAQLIEAKRIDFSRDKWDRDGWDRDYYKKR